MKPRRGSERTSTGGPKPSRKRGRKRPPQEAGPSSKESEVQQQPQKRPVGKGAVRKVKGQEKWTLVPKTSITTLESILDLSILSALTMRGKDKDESQRHLNLLKERFLASCAQLRVPPRTRKQGDMLQSSRLYQAESKRQTAGKKTLKAIEEEVRTVVETLELMEVKTDSLDQETRILRGKVEDEEDGAQEILQLSRNGVLNLPPLPPHVTRELPLQERMAKDPEVAARLATALRHSAELQDVKALLELTHKQADQLLLRALGPSPGTGPEDPSTSSVQGVHHPQRTNSPS